MISRTADWVLALSAMIGVILGIPASLFAGATAASGGVAGIIVGTSLVLLTTVGGATVLNLCLNRLELSERGRT